MITQPLIEIMPVLVILVSFFGAGYGALHLLTVNFFKTVMPKRPDYSHLEY